MKELSIEEKANRYDEAIERAKKWYDANTNEGYRGIFEDIFPELKESEDEKIRKELIEKVKETPACIGFNDKNAVLAWLEKQGDKDKLIQELGEYKVKYTQEVLSRQLEKQGEPTDINPSEFDLRLNKLLKQFKILPKEELASSLSFYLNVVQNDGTYKAEEKQGEQKPAEWSEKDKDNIQRALYYVDYYQTHEADTKEAEECFDWLKSLKPQNNITDEELAQAKKDAYNDALDKIEYHSGEPTFDDGWSAAIDYIRKKSLKPQNHWKPSDEQLEALKNAIHIKPFENPSDSLLWGLYEQIKKLKE